MGKKVIPLSDIAYFRAKFPELFGDFVYITLKFFRVNGASFSKRRGVNQDMFAVLNLSAVLDSHTCSIRNIQIVRQDLFPLVAENNKGKRLPSTTINAFGASIQDQFNSSDEGADFCVFSSWLAVLADGKVGEKDEKNVGAFGDHVMQAVRSHTVTYNILKENSQLINQCPSGTKEEILARTRWAIPLCSGSPLHWVLGSVDFSKNEI
jgi:hypothetical protein